MGFHLAEMPSRWYGISPVLICPGPLNFYLADMYLAGTNACDPQLAISWLLIWPVTPQQAISWLLIRPVTPILLFSSYLVVTNLFCDPDLVNLELSRGY